MDVARLFCELDHAADTGQAGTNADDRPATLAAVVWWLVQEVSAHTGADFQAASVMVAEMARTAVAEMAAPAIEAGEGREVH